MAILVFAALLKAADAVEARSPAAKAKRVNVDGDMIMVLIVESTLCVLNDRTAEASKDCDEQTQRKDASKNAAIRCRLERVT